MEEIKLAVHALLVNFKLILQIRSLTCEPTYSWFQTTNCTSHTAATDLKSLICFFDSKLTYRYSS